MPAVTARTERALVALLLAAFVALAVGFSLGPIFEGPDEIEHYRYVRALARTGRLPDAALIQSFDTGAWGEFHQPILYYALAALPVRALGDDGFDHFEERLNPTYGYRFEVPGNDNKNLFLHARAERFPYAESAIARTVHLLRLLSVAFGAGTALAGYGVFRLLWPDRPDRRLLALAALVFMPQFAYMSSVVTNDALSYLLITLSLYLLLRQVRDGPSWRRAALLGAVMGLALLTKLSAAFLIFPAAVTTLLDRRSWRGAALTVALVALIAGWWYARNWALYDDPTGVEVLFRWSAPSEQIRDGGVAFDIGWQRFGFAYETFWARFGGGSVAVSSAIYRFFDGLAALALAGAGFQLLRALRRPVAPQDRRYAAVMAVYGLAWLAAAFYWASRVWSGNQGRFLLPGIAAWAALIAFGLDAWTPRRLRAPVTLAVALALAGVATVSLLGYYLPAYRVSPAPDEIERPAALRFDGLAELIGSGPVSPRARPGETITLSLYWRALGPADRSLQTYLHSAGSDVVRRDSIPATGNLLATDWRAGETWAEHFTVTIPADAAPQQVVPLVAGLYDPATGAPIPARDASGNEVTPIVGRLAINGPPQPGEPQARFGSGVGLLDATIDPRDRAVEVCLTWIARAEMATDYTVVARLEGPDGALLDQLDRPPREGAYPTGAWARDERVRDCLTLASGAPLPDGWRVRVGLYDPATLERLPVEDRAGREVADSLLTLRPDERDSEH